MPGSSLVAAAPVNRNRVLLHQLPDHVGGYWPVRPTNKEKCNFPNDHSSSESELVETVGHLLISCPHLELSLGAAGEATLSGANWYWFTLPACCHIVGQPTILVGLIFWANPFDQFLFTNLLDQYDLLAISPCCNLWL